MIKVNYISDTILNSNYKNAFDKVREEVKYALTSSPSIISEYTNHLSKATGKFIRAKSLLICAMDESGNIPLRAIKIASAIEIFHLATLVHDDVIDESPMRRGIDTLHKKFGTRTAVICGDYLLSISLRMISSAFENDNTPENRMVNLLSRLCLGELNQHINNGNYSLSPIQYLKIIAGKTASLFEATFFMGAYMNKSDKSVLAKYSRVGRYIGMIFQLTDDCMDFETTEDIAGKPVQSDYDKNVITLPIIYALRTSETFYKEACSGSLSVEDVKKTVLKTGGLLYTRALAKKYMKKASALLEEIEMPEFNRSKIQEIINKAYRTF